MQIGFTFLMAAYPGQVVLEKRLFNGCLSWYDKLIDFKHGALLNSNIFGANMLAPSSKCWWLVGMFLNA